MKIMSIKIVTDSPKKEGVTEQNLMENELIGAINGNQDIQIAETYLKNVMAHRQTFIKYMTEEKAKLNKALIRYKETSIDGNHRGE